jgi:hypothetical protein
MVAGHFAVATAPQGLAVQGDHRQLLGRQATGHPAGQRGLEGDDIQAAEEDGIGGFRRRLTPTEAESLSQSKTFVAAELSNGRVGLAAGEHGEDGQTEDGG